MTKVSGVILSGLLLLMIGSNVSAKLMDDVIPGEPLIYQRKYTTQYDVYFIKYSKQYMGVGFKWEWFKAQSIAESALKADAKSPVGARGLMQVMPGTFKDIHRKQPSILNIDDPKWNIAAGIYYDSTLYNQWSSPRPFNDRMGFMLASYNGGLGNPLKAQKLCMAAARKDCNQWDSIIIYAPKVSSWIYKESLTYVDRIMALMGVSYKDTPIEIPLAPKPTPAPIIVEIPVTPVIPMKPTLDQIINGNDPFCNVCQSICK